VNGPIVFVGLSISSSWGNGHATTYRALLRGLAELGREAVFLERDVPWYAANRDLANPDFCALRLYDGAEALDGGLAALIETAAAVVIGSYVPDGPDAIGRILRRARGPVAFYDIDTPVTLAGLEAGTCAYLSRDLIPRFDVYFSFTGGPTLRQIERRHGARRAVSLLCGVDPTLYRPVGGAPGWDLGYLGTYSDDRQPALERLLIEPARRRPAMRFVVAGPQYPGTIDWPANVERIEHLPPAEHPAFYGAQRHTLNVTRADMVAAGWSPSVRLFEAGACGTPVISDRWLGLEDYYTVGESIVVADTPEDVLAALDAGEERRAALARSARAETLARHTGRHRATVLVEGLSEAATERASPVDAR
jgi:spore maturation protein CgeB